MKHQYSRFKNKSTPYAKVGRRVFASLFNAETFCSEHGIDVNSTIEYEENTELKEKVQEIAKYQKAILQEVLDRLDKCCTVLHNETEKLSTSLEHCHPLDRGFLEDRLAQTIGKSTATYETRKMVWSLLEELERLTGWHD